MARGWLVSLGVLVAVACSGRTKDRDATTVPGAAGDESVGGEAASGGASGGRTAGGGRAETGGRTDTGGAATFGGALATGGAVTAGGAPPLGECVLAYRHDRCCPEPEPVRREELESDPCLQEWTPLLLGPSKPSACPFPDCAVACQQVFPTSRVAELDVDGRCTFASECESADDCTTLFDTSACCDCGRAFPKTWEGSSECLLPEGATPPLTCGFCADVDCDQCARRGPLTCATSQSGLRLCEHGKALDLGPNQCAAEHACTGGVCPVCLAQGEAACGGPVPRPAECETDADCRERADNLNCETPPCENARCVQGCLADDDCGPSEVCDDHHCRPAPCSDNGACSPNHACLSDLCVRRSCKTSADCGDYCVNGACYDKPGRCGDGCLP
jgi:hypothetical protein